MTRLGRLCVLVVTIVAGCGDPRPLHRWEPECSPEALACLNALRRHDAMLDLLELGVEGLSGPEQGDVLDGLLKMLEERGNTPWTRTAKLALSLTDDPERRFDVFWSIGDYVACRELLGPEALPERVKSATFDRRLGPVDWVGSSTRVGKASAFRIGRDEIAMRPVDEVDGKVYEEARATLESHEGAMRLAFRLEWRRMVYPRDLFVGLVERDRSVIAAPDDARVGVSIGVVFESKGRRLRDEDVPGSPSLEGTGSRNTLRVLATGAWREAFNHRRFSRRGLLQGAVFDVELHYLPEPSPLVRVFVRCAATPGAPFEDLCRFEGELGGPLPDHLDLVVAYFERQDSGDDPGDSDLRVDGLEVHDSGP